MKTSTTIWTIVVIVILIIIGIVIYDNSQNSAMSTTTTTTTPATNAPMIPASAPSVLGTSSSASVGTYVVAANGMTLYTYSKDTAGVSTCTGSCATAWPPYTVTAGTSLVAAAGMTGTIATITRADGTTQVTYNGMPLYFFQSDTAPGETTGQNVGGFMVAKP